ncbi:hypothetical protein DM860_010630 [Cuscuta australis]|uniref:AAA+ ATPase domain-containing protein n=1 Tax=Cuscuta australis TaxID=267555 RepID=A0A328E1P2_9ASTE|nr:hypothetical protein DM860_010630 [Cuscuta australis]
MEVVSAIFGPVLERVVKPVLNEIGYVFMYSCNVENFSKKVDRMKVMRDGVKERVSAEEDNLQVIAPNVNTWLVRADQITRVEERIMNKKPDVEKGWCKGWCPNVKLRYTLSKKAKKSTEDVVELLVEGTAYINFSRPAPPLQVEFIGHRQYVEFKSRKSNEDEIIEALMDDKVNLVGICGMGGVGKTMIAKKVGKKVKEEAMFDEVVMVSVGPKPDIKKIQEGIAEALGFQLKEDNLIVRANKLQRRVALRKTLLILDDVWAWLDLEELGISFALSKECKIMLTSRHQDTCVQMEAQKTVVIEVLKEDEGWSLFKERAGSCVNEPGINRVAQDVSRECSHLPLALTTVGRALRDKTQHSWEDAREQLRKSAPSNIPEVLREVYQPLELSYNLLEIEEAQSLFLICSLFPEDYCIPLDFLIWYGLGLRVLKNVNGLEEARRRVSRLVEMLEDRFLLDDAGEGNEKFSMVNYEKYVKMHHVLQDVAIYIANKEDDVLISTHDIEWPEEMAYERLTCISMVSDALTVLPERLKCPQLNVLRLQCNNATLKMPGDFFHETPSLLVLDMPGSFLCSLPPSLECLKNLRVLYLHSQGVEDISVIGELKQLEMLICFCSAKTLPAKIGCLTNLRVLNMGDTCIQKIARGIFTQLARLEEVYLINNNCIEGSFLREISNLRYLTCLNIQILEASLLHTNISFQSFPRR